MLWQRFSGLLIRAKGTVNEHVRAVNCGLVHRLRFIPLLIAIISIVSILIITVILPFSYKPNTSAPFPYFEAPPNGYYIGTTVDDFISDWQLNLYGRYAPRIAATEINTAEKYQGQTTILKDTIIPPGAVVERKIQPYIPGEGLAEWETERFLLIKNIQFIPRDPSDLEKLKFGEVVDIIGIMGGMSKEWEIIIVVKDCQFLPAGLVPLPLPGGPTIAALPYSGY